MVIRITVRFTDDEKRIHEALVKSAKKNKRSLNKEMLTAFEVYLQEQKANEQKSK